MRKLWNTRALLLAIFTVGLGFYCFRNLEISFVSQVSSLPKELKKYEVLVRDREITDRNVIDDEEIFRVGLYNLRHFTSEIKFPLTFYCEAIKKSIQFEEILITNQRAHPFQYLLFAGGRPTTIDDWTTLKKQWRDMTWIAMTQESALTAYVLGLIPPKWMGLSYDIVATYHSKADMYIPYGRYINSQEVKKGESDRVFSEKTELVAWMSSAHCRGWGFNRTKLVIDIAKLIPVHMYGKCGNLSCPRNIKCDNQLRRYKFFLSFENSCCDEYITEKFWKALLTYKAVPVVIGAPQKAYEKVAPPNSFIHVDDFESVQDLANYLVMLANDDVAYKKFLKWNDFGTIEVNGFHDYTPIFKNGACNLLSFLSGYNRTTSSRTFDLYGEGYFGGCFRCSRSSYIGNYIIPEHLAEFQAKMKEYQTPLDFPSP